jgi:hypothetical protein
MWPKIKFGAQIFVTDVIWKFMDKISRRKVIGQRGRKQGRKTIDFEALLSNGSKMPKRDHG